MSLGVFWILGPCVTAAVMILTCLSLKRCRRHREYKAFEGTTLTLPPLESRLLAITPQSSDVFAVFFVTSGPSIYYLLTAPEVIIRCTYHQQPIPYCIPSKGYSGDKLLRPPELNDNINKQLNGCCV